MKRILSLLGVLAALSTNGHAFHRMHEAAADVLARRLDSEHCGMVKYHRFWTRVRGQDIVRELIGSVKLLRVSRQSLSTPECSNAAKAVACRNVGNFGRRHVAEEGAIIALASHCVSTKANPTASTGTRREAFRSDCLVA